jgi:NAD(P)H-dependent FMN reductase
VGTEPIHAVVLVGSARDGRLAPAVARWFVEEASQRSDLTLDTVDVAETPMPASLAADAPEVAALRPRLAQAEAIIVVAPEYNRSIPGPLKTLIDSFNPEWEAKPVGFISYGLSLAGGVRAVEHLRQVFAEFHSFGMKDFVSFPRILDHMDAQGTLVPPDGSAEAAKLMLDQLCWWARALRDAKARRAYRD